MASMSAIRKAIITRLGTIEELTPYWFEPDEINAPAYFIMPDSPFIDYQQAYSSGYAEWRFVVTIVVDRIDEELSQGILDMYVDPEGPVVATLRKTGLTDALATLTNDFVDVTTATNYGEYTRGRTKFLIAQIKLVVRAS